MSSDFLKDLDISEEERKKLASFGASNPKALLSLRRASRDAFDSYLGNDRADAIARQLEALLTGEEKESLKTPLTRPGHLGARMDEPPSRKDRKP